MSPLLELRQAPRQPWPENAAEVMLFVFRPRAEETDSFHFLFLGTVLETSSSMWYLTTMPSEVQEDEEPLEEDISHAERQRHQGEPSHQMCEWKNHPAYGGIFQVQPHPTRWGLEAKPSCCSILAHNIVSKIKCL